MIAVGDYVLHLADRGADLLVSGVVLDLVDVHGIEHAAVRWSDASRVLEPTLHPTANLIKIPA